MICGLVLMRQTPRYALRRKLAVALSQKNFRWGPSIRRISTPVMTGRCKKDRPLVHFSLHIIGKWAAETLPAWSTYKLWS